MAGPATGKEVLSHPRYLRRSPLPGAWRHPAAQRRNQSTRCRGLGFRPQGRCLRRRHPAELRSHRNPRRGPAQSSGVETTRGTIRTPKVASVAAGHTSVIAAMAGLRLPIESHPLQALVSEPIKPVNPCVVMSNAVHVYCSQSDKGELVIGGGIDPHISYNQRGGSHRHRGSGDGAPGTVSDPVPPCACCDIGPVSSTSVRTPVRSSPSRRSRASTSTAAGAPAAGRRRPAQAMYSPTRSRGTNRIRWRRRSRLNALSSGALVAEHGAAAVAH